MALLSFIAKLGLDKTGFDAGLKSAGKQVSGFGKDLKSQLAGAFTFAAAASFARDIATTVNRIKDLSEQFAVTTDEVQKMDFALKQSGLQFEDLGVALATIGRQRREAAEGDKETLDTFKKFGITLNDLQNPEKRNIDLLMQLSASTRAANMTAADQVKLLDLIGPKALKLSNVLSELSKIDPPEMFSAEDIDRIDKMTKAVERLKLELQVMVSKATLPFVENFAKAFGAIRERGLKGVPEAMSRLNPLSIGPNIAMDRARAKAGADATGAAEASIQIGKFMAGLFGGRGGGVMFDEKQKDKKLVKEATSSIQSDQFGRIGAFTGQAANTAIQIARQHLRETEQIKSALVRNGILIRGTD